MATGKASDGWSITTVVYERIDSPLGEPGRDLVSLESEQIAPLDVRDASLGNEPPDVSHAHAEVVGDFVDIHKCGQAGSAGGRFRSTRAGSEASGLSVHASIKVGAGMKARHRGLRAGR